MDKDVEAKVDKLCARYRRVEDTVSVVRPQQVPTGKNRSRLELTVREAVTQLRESRGVECSALVRLAYVRGLRGVQPGARLGEEELAEVSQLEYQLDRRLASLETHTVEGFRQYIRGLRAVERLEAMDTDPRVVEQLSRRVGKSFPLEQHARASVRSVVEMASMAGALAGTQAASYDVPRNA